MTTAIEDRIKAQELKLKQLKALKQKQEAQLRAAKTKKERADDTRRKVLLGALLMERMTTDTQLAEETNLHLARWLTRPADRELFSLPPLSPLAGAAS